MTRYAAVDVGSNSVRMMAAEVGPGGKTQILAQERQVTRLGAAVFRSGEISQEAMQFVCDNLARMSQVFRKLEVASVRAVATAAVRDASNQQEFLERATAALGAPVETISGQEEARLIHLGVQTRWPHPNQRVLIVDVGGGSTELILSEQGVLTEAFSKPLGAVRLTEVFLKNDPPAALEVHQMNEFIEEKLAAPLKRISGPFDRVIGTSATAAALVCAANRIPRLRRDEADHVRAKTSQIRKLFEELRGMTLAERRKVPGIGPRRAELIVAGAAVFLRILQLFEEGGMHYSAAGVRDGIIADLAARGVGHELSQLTREQRRVVEQMSRRFGVQLPHARKVSVLAHHLFEALHPLHKLPAYFGKMLEAAAYLHDIGHFVSDTGHHKHSHYLVMNAEMPGFTDAERQFVAALCRYHRKTSPTLRHSMFQAFDPDSRRALVLLTPLLRLADSLDRSHEQRVEKMMVELRNGNVIIGVESAKDTDLELWAAGRIADLFRETYEIPLVLARAKF
jgi:exopolyphosphatase/guanosine-5'-triphosphate,3'-diphosphate pyrophosphatase